MMRRFLLWLTARLPVKVIGRDEPYVEWYHVATFPRLLGGFRIQIHRFVRSDPDGLHDHPWGWSRSVVLSSWYLEERRDRIRVRKAGTTYGMTGDTFHRVILPIGARDCFTLFIHGPYVKHWGFINPTMPADGLHWRLPSWMSPLGGSWSYEARDRSPHRFDPWPARAPKGRELREEIREAA